MPKDSGLGQGMCQKVRMVAAGSLRAHHRRQQGEVVVLDQHDRVVAAGLGDHRVGEALVDRPVGLPVALAEHRPHVRDVAQRPEAFVGEAVVVALLLLLGQPDAGAACTRPARAAPARGRARRPTARSALPLPCAIQVPEQARITGSTAVTRPLAGRRTTDAAARPSVVVDVGLAVGDDDDLVAAQLRAQQRAQALGVPAGARGRASGGTRLPGRAGAPQVGGQRRQLAGDWRRSAAPGPRRAAARAHPRPSRASSTAPRSP